MDAFYMHMGIVEIMRQLFGLRGHVLDKNSSLNIQTKAITFCLGYRAIDFLKSRTALISGAQNRHPRIDEGHQRNYV
jgi:hypothetical protein